MAQHKREEVAKRLSRIEGHFHAVRRMLQEGRSYPEVVQQISAVKSSLDSVIEVIVEDLVEDCIKKTTNKEGHSSALQLREVVAWAR
jgi:DNA-binding FrmR family transcriptional regulator